MEEKHVNLIFRNLEESEWSVVSQSSFESIDFKNPSSLKNVDHQDFNSDTKKQVNEDIFKEIIDFASFQFEGKSIIDTLSYQGVFLWYYHRFRIYYTLRESFYIIRTIEEFLKDSQPVNAYTNDPRVIEYFVANERVACIQSPIEMKAKKVSKLTIVSFAIKFAIRSLSGITKLNSLRKRKHIVVFNGKHIQKEGEYNPYYGHLLREGNSEEWAILRLNTFPKMEAGLPGWNKDKNVPDTSFLQINSESVLCMGIIKNYVEIKKASDFLRNLTNRKNEFKAEMSPVQRLFIDEFISLKESSKLYLIQYICFRSFFKKGKVKTITTISEHSSNERSVLDGARRSGVKTIGVQHGAITPMNISYMYGDHERNYHVAPDQTILWGKNSQRVLTEKSCYTEQNSIVLGQLRTDIQYDILSNVDQITIPGISNNKPIVVFSSQPQPDQRLRTQAAEDVIEAARKFEDLQFVIKLHPLEEKAFYEALLTKNDKILLLGKEVDLYELLAKSALHITCYSTVGAEAVSFGKSLITIDYFQDDLSHYHAKSIARQATNRDELFQLIHHIKESNFAPEPGVSSFVKANTHIIDGETAKRYVEYIESL